MVWIPELRTTSVVNVGCELVAGTIWVVNGDGAGDNEDDGGCGVGCDWTTCRGTCVVTIICCPIVKNIWCKSLVLYKNEEICQKTITTADD